MTSNGSTLMPTLALQLVLEALWSVTGWIEGLPVTGRGKKKRAQYFVGLSEGMKYRDMIQAAG